MPNPRQRREKVRFSSLFHLCLFSFFFRPTKIMSLSLPFQYEQGLAQRTPSNHSNSDASAGASNNFLKPEQRTLGLWASNLIVAMNGLRIQRRERGRGLRATVLEDMLNPIGRGGYESSPYKHSNSGTAGLDSWEIRYQDVLISLADSDVKIRPKPSFCVLNFGIERSSTAVTRSGYCPNPTQRPQMFEIQTRGRKRAFNSSHGRTCKAKFSLHVPHM